MTAEGDEAVVEKSTTEAKDIKNSSDIKSENTEKTVKKRGRPKKTKKLEPTKAKDTSTKDSTKEDSPKFVENSEVQDLWDREVKQIQARQSKMKKESRNSPFTDKEVKEIQMQVERDMKKEFNADMSLKPESNIDPDTLIQQEKNLDQLIENFKLHNRPEVDEAKAKIIRARLKEEAQMIPKKAPVKERKNVPFKDSEIKEIQKEVEQSMKMEQKKYKSYVEKQIKVSTPDPDQLIRDQTIDLEQTIENFKEKNRKIVQGKKNRVLSADEAIEQYLQNQDSELKQAQQAQAAMSEEKSQNLKEEIRTNIDKFVMAPQQIDQHTMYNITPELKQSIKNSLRNISY